MAILVTGSAGHLGEALVRALRGAGRPVRGADRKSSAFTECVGSILDRAFVRGCMQGATAVIHTAGLHKPHVATHSLQEFVDHNVSGTILLLEEAVAAGVGAFVFTSSTSALGEALTPRAGEPAAWVTEDTVPVPKNSYGVTKLMAESLCEFVARKRQLPVVVLRTSRFFADEDDDANIRRDYALANVQANEMLHRRVDLEDVVNAHLLAVEKASSLRFARYIISATTPFTIEDLTELRRSLPGVVSRLFPECESLYAARGWRLFAQIDRVYVNRLARQHLGWRPKYDFAYVMGCLRANRDFASPLARAVGAKGYHDESFAEGPYPVMGP
jgi:UDP-glucose 4-epimerase